LIAQDDERKNRSESGKHIQTYREREKAGKKERNRETPKKREKESESEKDVSREKEGPKA